MNTEPKWYYSDGTNTIGPFDRQAMTKMVSAGLINGDTQVIPEGGQSWSRLAESPLRNLLPPVPHPATPPPASTKATAKKKKSMLEGVQDFVCAFSGLKPLVDFQFSFLFKELFTRRSKSEVESYFNCGCSRTTPELSTLSPEWPRPWVCWRILGFGFLILVAFCIGFQGFENERMLPGLMIVGGFFVPLACVALFFELNVLRNISLYQVIKFIIAGGALSIFVALLLYATVGSELNFLGAMSAGIVEETAKVLTAVMLLRGATQYKWILNGLLVGAAVGAGFAGFESSGYIFDSVLLLSSEGLAGFYRTLVERAVFAPFCHVVWTASVVGALWRVKKDQPFRFSMLWQKEFLRIFVFVMLLHMLWNSGLIFALPRNYALLKGELYLWLTSFVGSWYLVLLLVQEGLSQVTNAQSGGNDSYTGIDSEQWDRTHRYSAPGDASAGTSVKTKTIVFACIIIAFIGLGLRSEARKKAKEEARQEEAQERERDAKSFDSGNSHESIYDQKLDIIENQFRAQGLKFDRNNPDDIEAAKQMGLLP